ncbi:hypothetical protein QN277_001984 [Acacia crassicarpa]|uniref:Uncharacterized protein n=1 Tax=Acacia crassicarpa TaxID=499986 RepID=A0AAE1THD7_9FABA|nr:hypothetical protein QN277_001984 [Acacia crassicarpa]
MVALLGIPRKPMIKDNATSGTIFGHRKGRVSLTIQEDPHCMPFFLIELPMYTSAQNKEMASDIWRIALESETKTQKKKLMEEFVWAVYCNGKKSGLFNKEEAVMGEDEMYVMQHLRGASMGAGVIPSLLSEKESPDGELMYMRARF